MKRKILFVMPGLYGGGAEKSLVNLLNLFDYSEYDVDLLLFRQEGLFLSQVPKEVKLLPTPRSLEFCYSSLTPFAFKSIEALRAGIIRIVGTVFCKFFYKENEKQMRWKYFYFHAIRPLEGYYDIAVAYLHGETSFYVIDKVNAEKKFLWVHNDYDKIKGDDSFFGKYFSKANRVVSISEACVEKLKVAFPDLRERFCMVPNLTSATLIRKMADERKPAEYKENLPIILSIGRLNVQKGFDFAIAAAEIMKKRGYHFEWYVLGVGELHDELTRLILEKNLKDCFKLLGARENPYPYIKHCTILAQTSRFEGKSVVLDEAKILGKPILVTNYSTVHDQIIEGEEGVIVETDPMSIADGMIQMLESKQLRKTLSENLEKGCYDNADRVCEYMQLFSEG